MSVLQQLQTDRKVVEKLMSENTNARDDDRVLIFDYLTKCLHIRLNPMDEYLIKHGKAFESLTRARRTIQNEQKRLVASPEVRQKRFKKEVELHNHFAKKREWQPVTDELGHVVSYREVYI